MILQLHKKIQKVGFKMNMKKNKVIFNYFMRDNKIEIHDEVTKCVQNYISLEQKIGACSDHEK